MRTSLTTMMIAVCLGTLCFSQPAKGGWDPRKEVDKVADKVKDEVNKKKKEAEKAAKKAREKAEREAKKAREKAERIAKAQKEAAAKAREDAERTTLKAREDAKQSALKARDDVKREALRKRDELLVEAWGEAGRQAYPAGAATMAARYASRAKETLSARERAVLKPHLGDCVDRVRIVWGALPLNEWKAAGKSIHLGGAEASAQTYGYNIYVRAQRAEFSDQQRLELLIHELVHVRQFEKYGQSLSNFGYHYFKKYKQAGESYENNSMERSAHGAAARLISQVLADYQNGNSLTPLPGKRSPFPALGGLH